jgi:hypothetical protein
MMSAGDYRGPCRLSMYATRSSIGAMTRFGIVGWLVRDHTVNAVIDMPGVLAIALKAGALSFGEAVSVFSTLWHSEQMVRA